MSKITKLFKKVAGLTGNENYDIDSFSEFVSNYGITRRTVKTTIETRFPADVFGGKHQQRHYQQHPIWSDLFNKFTGVSLTYWLGEKGSFILVSHTRIIDEYIIRELLCYCKKFGIIMHYDTAPKFVKKAKDTVMFQIPKEAAALIRRLFHLTLQKIQLEEDLSKINERNK